MIKGRGSVRVRGGAFLSRCARGRFWKRFYFQRLFRSPRLRRSVAHLIAATRPKSEMPVLNKDLRDRFDKGGLVVLEKHFSADKIDEISAYLRLNGFAHSDSVQAYYKDEDVISAPKVFELANDELILELVEGHIKCKPTLTAVKAWWLYANPDKDFCKDYYPFYGVQQNEYHRDIDDWRYVRVLVYMSDVDSDGGPHQYIPETQALPLPSLRALDFDRHKGYEKLLDRKVEVTGAKGTAVVIDPMGLHRAKVPMGDDRLMMQFTYGLGPHHYTPTVPLIIESKVGVKRDYLNRFLVSH